MKLNSRAGLYRSVLATLTLLTPLALARQPTDVPTALSSPHPDIPPSWLSSVPGGDWELRIGAGSVLESDNAGERSVDFGTLTAITYGITDRLSIGVPLPVLAYRWGERGNSEWILRGGFPALGYSSIDGFVGDVDLGVSAGFWLTPSLSTVSNASSSLKFGSRSRRELQLKISAGLVWTLNSRVQLAMGAGLDKRVSLRPTVNISGGYISTPSGNWLELGAVQTLGYRPLPLVSIMLVPSFSFDTYASLQVNADTRDTIQRYIGGFTWTF